MAKQTEILDPEHVNEKFDAPVCFCGAPSIYHADTIEYYNGKDYGHRWICSRFPVCRGSVGAHPDGKPLGSIADPETKKARMQVHSLIDPLWQKEPTGRARRHKRASVYRWLARLLHIEEYHTGNLTAQQCRELVLLILKHPYADRHKHREMRFIGADGSLGYRHGEKYTLQIQTSPREDGRGEKPTITTPHYCPYDSWRLFYQNWAEVTE